MADELLTVSEAAEKIGVSNRTVQRYCKQGRLNHMWVQGTRHKELRIIPPISLDKLPGSRKKTAAAPPGDYVNRKDYEKKIEELNNELNLRDFRIDQLETDIAALKEKLETLPAPAESGTSPSPTPPPSLPITPETLNEIVHDYEKVRPAEKKLIVRLAGEVKEHSVFLRKMGMKPEA